MNQQKDQLSKDRRKKVGYQWNGGNQRDGKIARVIIVMFVWGTNSISGWL